MKTDNFISLSVSFYHDRVNGCVCDQLMTYHFLISNASYYQLLKKTTLSIAIHLSVTYDVLDRLLT